MEVGEIRIADQSDFDRLRDLCEIHDEWTQVYRSNMTLVWTRANDVSDFHMIKVGGCFVTLSAYHRIHRRQQCLTDKAGMSKHVMIYLCNLSDRSFNQ